MIESVQQDEQKVTFSDSVTAKIVELNKTLASLRQYAFDLRGRGMPELIHTTHAEMMRISEAIRGLSTLAHLSPFGDVPEDPKKIPIDSRFPCSCIERVVGSWDNIGIDRVVLFGTNDGLSAAKRCPSCRGTGKPNG
jgi:hypothetical protein